MTSKKITAAALAAVVTFGAGAAVLPQSIGLSVTANAAETITEGDWEYDVTGDDTVAIIKYTGSAANLVIPSTLGWKTVTEIGAGAFRNNQMLKSVTIPDSVTNIGGSAFWGCSSLTSVTIPNSVTIIGQMAFDGCSSLGKIEVSSQNQNYTSVAGVLFDKDQTAIVCYPAGKEETSYEIPDSVTSIGVRAFYGCSSLTSVTITDSVTNIDDQAFAHCRSLESMIIPNSVTNIGDGAFGSCSSLTSVTIPDSVTSINYEAFYGCSSLESVTIPDSVTSIGHWAFARCTSLTSVTIPDGVTGIATFVFQGCSSLESVTIPNSVIGIGWCAFNGCSSLTDITIPDSVTYIGMSAFSGCSLLTSVTIPDGVTSIGSFAFGSCSSLEKIEVGSQNENYTSVDGVLFDKDQIEIVCYPAGKKDTSYEIPNSVTSIVEGAFDGCSSLKSVAIPNSVTRIGSENFSACSSLEKISVGSQNENYSSVDGVLFDKDQTKLICYPAGKKDKSYTIPNSVTGTSGFAFSCCSSLEKIEVGSQNERYSSVDGVLFNKDQTWLVCYPAGKKDTSYEIPDTVTYIDNYAIRDCSSLKNVIIPNSVTSIGSSFENCSSLTSITFKGTMAEWRAIRFGTTYLTGNSPYDTLQIICTDGIINQHDPENPEEITFTPNIPADTEMDEETERVLSGITVTDSNGAFEDGTILNIKPIETTDGKFSFDITFTKDGEEVQPKSAVTVKVPLPEQFKDAEKLYVYHVDSENKYTLVESEIKDGYVVFTADKFSEYILSAEEIVENNSENSGSNSTSTSNSDNTSTSNSDSTSSSDTDSASTSNADSKPSNSDTGIALAIAPVVLALGAVAVAVTKKRK